ncbi:MAG: Rieske 2Fe-2S domain-containing protein [Roseburia sp.]|nr:Rieske 2Fe-2S domain-containing protein [Roseburia sp.]
MRIGAFIQISYVGQLRSQTVNSVYRSVLKKRCPHMGCALKWNRAEHSRDCSCHGSFFYGK